MSETTTAATEPTNPMRRVRFSEATPQTLEYDPLDGQEQQRQEAISKDDVWVSKEECHRNKERCIRLGRSWERQGYDVLLDASYKKPVKEVQSRLDAFCTLGEEDCIPRGIERFISSKHADERRLAKVRCVEGVVDLCTYLRRQDDGRTPEQVQSELRALSIEHSRPSRHFARRIAISDAKAVQEDLLEEEEQQKEQAAAADDDDMTVVTTLSSSTTKSTTTTTTSAETKLKKGLAYRARKGTKRITRMITSQLSSVRR